MEKKDLDALEARLSYSFRDRNLLEESLRHSSYVNEQPNKNLRDNERFEFLGDAVLNLVIGDLLMRRYPDTHEGDLSRMRASLVNETQLAEIAISLDLGTYLSLGKGEVQTNGREKHSILADAFEAVIAAVYQDGGFSAAFRLITSRFDHLLDVISSPTADQDYKSRLQEFIQNTHARMPVYTVVGENGPDHDKTFKVQVDLGDSQAEGIGKSKKAAAQDAAKHALTIFNENQPS